VNFFNQLQLHYIFAVMLKNDCNENLIAIIIENKWNDTKKQKLNCLCIAWDFLKCLNTKYCNKTTFLAKYFSLNVVFFVRFLNTNPLQTIKHLISIISHYTMVSSYFFGDVTQVTMSRKAVLLSLTTSLTCRGKSYCHPELTMLNYSHTSGVNNYHIFDISL